MSTTTDENPIFDFEVSKNERGMAKSVPKLQGASILREWETRMLMRALGINNPIYVQLVKDEINMPPAPIYEDQSYVSVKALLFKEADSSKEMESITEYSIEARSIELVVLGLALQKHHADGERKWGTSQPPSFHLSTIYARPDLGATFRENPWGQHYTCWRYDTLARALLRGQSSAILGVVYLP
ncbi:hypothetical protein N7463_006837 [Penicillium fimorum]|uniref:Uncharacterized protein n=1 Tax=Penicillium fimorum TaxID=1882269 RepID=A0A9W9XV73_9EURO|nr:hypothetical protein N7463_006837 [Penicillium fimorum]